MRHLFFIFTTVITLHMNAQNIKLEDLSSSLSHGNEVYGAYCGLAGTPPPSRILIEELIINKDMSTLSEWLRSPNLVIQTYAAEAFIRLAAKGVVGTGSDQNLVMKIHKKEDIISTCKGCVYEHLTIKQCLALVEKNNPLDDPSER